MMEKIIDIFTYNIDYLLLHDIINLMNSNKKLNKIPFRKTVILFVDNITDCINKHCDEINVKCIDCDIKKSLQFMGYNVIFV